MITSDHNGKVRYSIEAYSAQEMQALIKALNHRKAYLESTLKPMPTGFRRNFRIIEISHLDSLMTKTNRLLDAMEAAADTTSGE